MTSESRTYSWNGVMEFLQDQKKNARFGPHDNKVDVQYYEERLAALQSQLKVAEARNRELTLRVSFLESTLKTSQTEPKVEHRRTRSGKARFDWEPEIKSFEALKPEAPPLPRRIWSIEVMDLEADESIAVARAQARPKATLKSHIDSVRALEFLRHRPVLVSASEDCSVKIWNVAATEAEPYCTLRGHTCPILSMTVGAGYSGLNSEQLAFSSDTGGFLRVWKVPLSDEVEPYGRDSEFAVGVWSAHYSAIWSLAHHDTRNQLLSASADGTVRLWTVPDLRSCQDLLRAGLTDIPQTSYCLKPDATPAVVTWLDHSTSFVVGYTQQFLAVFDSSTSKHHILTYEADQNASVYSVKSAPGLIVSGHEDRRIRFFDPNSNTCFKNLVGHTDAVTALALHSHYLISGSHDGSLRTWDMRTYQCLHELPAHKKKYDEAVLSVATHMTLPLLASGGADSLIKFYQFS